jgi:hypothetical protein
VPLPGLVASCVRYFVAGSLFLSKCTAAAENAHVQWASPIFMPLVP